MAPVRTVVGPGVLDTPGGIALDAAGDLFVADTGHCRVVVVPARSGVLDGLHVRAGHASTLAGASCTGRGALGPPSAVAVDRQGDVFIAEATAQRVQEVRAGSRTVVTVAGNGTAGFNGDGPNAAARQLDEPTGVAVNAAGDLFIADTANCRVRVVPAATTTLFGRAVSAGGLFTVAGTGVCGSAGQGGPLGTAQLWNPVAVALDGGRRPPRGRQRRPVRAAGAVRWRRDVLRIGRRRRGHRRGRRRHGRLRALRRRRAAGERAHRRAQRPPRPDASARRAPCS